MDGDGEHKVFVASLNYSMLGYGDVGAVTCCRNRGSVFRPEDVSLLERCSHFRGWYVQASMELGPEDVSLLERCPHFRGWYVQASMELGPEDVSVVERCPHFRGWYVQASMELGPAVHIH